MKYLRKYTIKPILFGFIIISVFNCKPSRSGGDENMAGSDTVSQDIYPGDIFPDEDSMSTTYLFPSPGEILEEVLVPGIEFNPAFMNPAENVSGYNEVRQEALNLGVYISDLAYSNLYGDQNTALEYLKTVKDLALQLNIYKVVDDNFYERVQNNLTDKDSMSIIINEMYGGIRDHLENSYRNDTYALIASGALIEALYISAMSVKDFSGYEAIVHNIFEQKHLLKNFYAYARQFKKDKDVGEILKLFENYLSILEKTKSNTTPVTVTREKGQLKIKGGEDIQVTEENFQIFKENIIRTRREITEVNN